MQTHDCFILSYLKYGDHDAVVHGFSAETGAITFFFKGIYAPKNKKKPYLFPLNRLSITIPKAITDHQISKVSKIELHSEYLDFNDVRSHSILFFIGDFLNQVLREEGSNEALFTEIQHLRAEIAERNYDAYLKFLIRFLAISGFAPQIESPAFLNPETGVFEDAISHKHFGASISELWKHLLQNDNQQKIRIHRADKNAFLDSIIIYCQLHISGFHIPNSLAVVRQIFE